MGALKAWRVRQGCSEHVVGLIVLDAGYNDWCKFWPALPASLQQPAFRGRQPQLQLTATDVVGPQEGNCRL